MGFLSHYVFAFFDVFLTFFSTFFFSSVVGFSAAFVFGAFFGSSLIASVALIFSADGLIAAAFGSPSTTTVIWQVRLRMRYARPIPTARNRFQIGPPSINNVLIRKSSG